MVRTNGLNQVACDLKMSEEGQDGDLNRDLQRTGNVGILQQNKALLINSPDAKSLEDYGAPFLSLITHKVYVANPITRWSYPAWSYSATTSYNALISKALWILCRYWLLSRWGPYTAHAYVA